MTNHPLSCIHGSPELTCEWEIDYSLLTQSHNTLHSTHLNKTFLRMSWVRLYLSYNGVVDHHKQGHKACGCKSFDLDDLLAREGPGAWWATLTPPLRPEYSVKWKNMRHFNGVITLKDKALCSARVGRLLMMSCVKDELYLLLCIV